MVWCISLWINEIVVTLSANQLLNGLNKKGPFLSIMGNCSLIAASVFYPCLGGVTVNKRGEWLMNPQDWILFSSLKGKVILINNLL